MSKTVWIIIAVVCVVGLGSLIAFTKKDGINVDNINPAAIIEPTETALGDNITGSRNSKVTVFEYADYQCSGCAGAQRTMAPIKEAYKDKVAFVFRNYPLTQGHPNALAAATAAEAAGLHGKYWEMGNLLFEQQSQWSSLAADKRGDVFISYASQLGIDQDQFRKDLSNSKIQAKIQTDLAIGRKIGVSATPSFFVNDRKIDSNVVEEMLGGQTDNFLGYIDQAQKYAGETPPARP